MAKKLVCSCGNENIHGVMKPRYPLAPEPWWSCPNCGAAVWDSMVSKTTSIREVELPNMRDEMAAEMGEAAA